LHYPAASLTLPERKQLEIARTLATRPKLLLLDESMAGLNPTEVDQMIEFLRRLKQESGVTLLIIEHVMRAIMSCRTGSSSSTMVKRSPRGGPRRS
jgi:branched-chain amino acid transport system ATP-binding protein